MGTWNVRGISEVAKREEEVGDAFRKGRFEWLALKGTKLKKTSLDVGKVGVWMGGNAWAQPGG